MIAQATEGFRKELVSDRPSGERPQLVVATDEGTQVDYVIQHVLEHREAGIDLKRQVVLFRTGHHSDQLEVELARRGIPFVKTAAPLPTASANSTHWCRPMQPRSTRAKAPNTLLS